MFYLWFLLFPLAFGGVVLILLVLYAITGTSLLDFFQALGGRGATLTCWHCGRETPADRKTCRHCQQELQ